MNQIFQWLLRFHVSKRHPSFHPRHRYSQISIYIMNNSKSYQQTFIILFSTCKQPHHILPQIIRIYILIVDISCIMVLFNTFNDYLNDHFLLNVLITDQRLLFIVGIRNVMINSSPGNINLPSAVRSISTGNHIVSCIYFNYIMSNMPGSHVLHIQFNNPHRRDYAEQTLPSDMFSQERFHHHFDAKD